MLPLPTRVAPHRMAMAWPTRPRTWRCPALPCVAPDPASPASPDRPQTGGDGRRQPAAPGRRHLSTAAPAMERSSAARCARRGGAIVAPWWRRRQLSPTAGGTGRGRWGVACARLARPMAAERNGRRGRAGIAAAPACPPRTQSGESGRWRSPNRGQLSWGFAACGPCPAG